MADDTEGRLYHSIKGRAYAVLAASHSRSGSNACTCLRAADQQYHLCSFWA